MPRQLRIARVVIIIQAVLNLAFGGFALALLSQQSERAWQRDNLAFTALLLVVQLLAMVLLVVCAARFAKAEPWTRHTALAVEWVVVAGGGLTLLAGAVAGQFQPQALVPLVPAVLVLRSLLHAESGEWFGGGLREWSGDQRQ